ncbi:hypothetical protein MG293_018366 [Ovis ammon polii]|uniref:Polypeptide N-acetylgalactosaminyltransferase-like protein 3 n=1 Tax=Ovis ammon polii TaxID=230172 RepID=A0AAD4Y2K0_OVIAM|nr:hypothetical protein MG293_018366 [Ovis ammon polii]
MASLRRVKVLLVLNLIAVAGFVLFLAKCRPISVRSGDSFHEIRPRAEAANLSAHSASPIQDAVLKRLSLLEDIVYRQLNGRAKRKTHLPIGGNQSEDFRKAESLLQMDWGPGLFPCVLFCPVLLNLQMKSPGCAIDLNQSDTNKKHGIRARPQWRREDRKSLKKKLSDGQCGYRGRSDGDQPGP